MAHHDVGRCRAHGPRVRVRPRPRSAPTSRRACGRRESVTCRWPSRNSKASRADDVASTRRGVSSRGASRPALRCASQACGDALRRLERATSGVKVAAAASGNGGTRRRRRRASTASSSTSRLHAARHTDSGSGPPCMATLRRNDEVEPRSPVAAHGQSVKHAVRSEQQVVGARRGEQQARTAGHRPVRLELDEIVEPTLPRRRESGEIDRVVGKGPPLPQCVAEHLLGRLGRDR